MDNTVQQTQSFDPSFKLRDIEEKQKLLKDRVLLIGQSFIEERDKTSLELKDIKKSLIELKEETRRMKEILQNITQQLSNTARKEELLIIQRQFDLFRNE